MGRMLWVVSVIVGLMVLWILVKLVKWIKVINVQYRNLVEYLMERGVKRVVLVPPRWFGYGMVRLYSADGMFVEELLVGRDKWWVVEVMGLRLRQEGFDVEVKRV